MLLVVDRLFLCSCMGVLGCCCGIAMHVMRCSELFNVFFFFFCMLQTCNTVAGIYAKVLLVVF